MTRFRMGAPVTAPQDASAEGRNPAPSTPGEPVLKPNSDDRVPPGRKPRRLRRARMSRAVTVGTSRQSGTVPGQGGARGGFASDAGEPVVLPAEIVPECDFLRFVLVGGGHDTGTEAEVNEDPAGLQERVYRFVDLTEIDFESLILYVSSAWLSENAGRTPRHRRNSRRTHQQERTRQRVCRHRC